MDTKVVVSQFMNNQRNSANEFWNPYFVVNMLLAERDALRELCVDLACEVINCYPLVDLRNKKISDLIARAKAN